jgi:hypothetical protein
MAEILVVAVASAVTSGISISAAFVMVGTWLGVDNSTSSDDDGVKKSIQKSKLETKIDWNNCSLAVAAVVATAALRPSFH